MTEAEIRWDRSVFWWNVRVRVAQAAYAAIWIGPPVILAIAYWIHVQAARL